MDFKIIVEKSRELRKKYAVLETRVSGRPWGVSQRTQGFVGDVGDFMKLIMAKEGLRKIEDLDDKLKHELIDCFWSIITIADELGVDLEKEFISWAEEQEKIIIK